MKTSYLSKTIPSFVDLQTMLHVAGFEAFEHSEYTFSFLRTNCPTANFLCCGNLVETGLSIRPDTIPGWFIFSEVTQ
jgi:hypothetical protein